MLGILALLIQLILDTAVSWVRMFIALFISVLVGLAVGILANRSQTAERIILPIFDILQTLPIVAFFPFVIYVVVATLPGIIGINAAVVFLIFTSMVWNIGFGAYEGIRTMPREYAEVSQVFQLSPIERLRKVLIPAAMPKVVEQSTLSWSIGLFYLVTSEIFSTGSKDYAVQYGIGPGLVHLAFSGNLAAYALGIIVFIAFVVATRLLFFRYLENRFVKRTTPRGGHSWLKLGQRRWRWGERAEHRFAIAGKILERKTMAAIGWRNRLHEARRIQRIIRNGTWTVLAGLVVIMIVVLLLNRGLASSELDVLYAMAFSLGRIWLAFALTLAIALPLGIYVVFMTKRSESYMVLFQILASIPATVLLPAIVIAFKGAPYRGELVALAIFFLSGFWYLLFSIVSTRASMQESWEEAKEIFQVKGKSAWKYFYLKAVLPGLITGSITAIAAEWNASIVAEYFTTTGISGGSVVSSVGTGLGKLLDLTLASGNIQLMALGLINLTIVIIVVNRLLWKRSYNRVMSVYR
ncbi:MAG: ABC transporter permease subunit [Candidatus Micrarchaeota archaeon]|nr:ABC transporter permease subunit [Candidatus Micrarchaeota archaeon]